MYEPVQRYTNSFQPKSPSSFTFGSSTFCVQPKAKKAGQSQSNNSYLTQAAPVQSREPLGHSHQSQTVIDRNVNELGLLEYLKVGAAIITSLPIDYVEYLVVVQPNSSAPAKVNALATTQWENGKIVIKTAPGQDRLVIHEFGHAIKLMQGLVVEPTIEVNGVPVNDEQELETQADCDGQRAVALGKAAVSNLDLGTARLLQKPIVPHLTGGVGMVASPSLIQRKVYVEKQKFFGDKDKQSYREKTKTKQEERGEEGQKVSSMMRDEKNRYFKNKQELWDYADKKTETIGYVENKNQWIRINPQKLLVIGENHVEHEFANIVNAVGTKKFRYELYTEVPDELKDTKDVEEAMRAREIELEQEVGLNRRESSRRHEAEDFFPKILAALLHCGTKQKPSLLYSTTSQEENDVQLDPHNQPLAHLVRIGVLVAQALLEKNEDKESALYKLANRNKTQMEKLKEALSKFLVDKRTIIQCDLKFWEEFKECFHKYTINKSQAVGTFFEDYNTVKSDWVPDEVTKNSLERKNAKNASLLRQSELLRDTALYQHIKEAQQGGDLLFGIGEIHRKRLEPILDRENIDNKNAEDFINEQQREYP